MLGESIPIDDMLFRGITVLPYQGKKPVEEFVGKSQHKTIPKEMKKQYNIVKKSRGYEISSLNDPAVHFSACTLARNIMRKCHANKVPAPVVSLVA